MHTVETFKDMVEEFWAHTQPLIADTHLIVSIQLFQAHNHLSSVWRILDRIVQNVAHNLTYASAISDDL